jgi:AraC-like DNA-binding protein
VLGTGVLQNVAGLSLEGILFGQDLPSRLSRRRRFPHIDFYYNQYLGHQPQEGKLPGHYHPWPELATVLEGRLNVVWDATVYESQAGDWLAFSRNILHAECSLMSRQAYRVFWFIMLPDRQLGLHETSYNRRLGYQLEYACRLPDVPPDLRRAVDRLSQGQWSPLEKARWELIKLVAWCLSGLMGDAAEAVDLCHPIVDDARRILQESTGRPPTVADLAGRVGLSPNYLSNLFHRYSGQTIRQFVANHRIELARGYLADPRCSVKEVGYQLGFATKQHFTHTFRRIMGLTPTAYRQSLLRHRGTKVAGGGR